MRNFLNNLEHDKVTKFYNAAESDEKLFWKLLKGQRSSSQMSAFFVKDKLITDRNLIREKWVDHFEALGTPSNSENFDSNFLVRVTASVEDIFKILPLYKGRGAKANNKDNYRGTTMFPTLCKIY